MIKAVFVMSDLDYIKDYLDNKGIIYKEWYSEEELEVRVDISDVTVEELEQIKQEFAIDEIYSYDYIIFWK